MWEQPQVQAAIISAVATMVTAGVGIGVLAWQLRRQLANTSAANLHAERMRIKKAIYDEIVRTVGRASRAEVNLSSYVRGLCSDVVLHRDMTAKGLPGLVPKARPSELIELKWKASSRSTDIIRIVERWQIIDPGMRLFQTAINVATHDIDAAWLSYFQTAIGSIPAEDPRTKQLLPYRPPDDQRIAQLRLETDKVLTALNHLGSYIADFQAEMQKSLLGEIFGNDVAVRTPLDPDYIVLDLRKSKELIAHLETKTAWGRNKAEVEARVREQLKASGAGGTKSTEGP